MGCKHIIGFGCIVYFVNWKNIVKLRKCDKQLRFMSHNRMHVEFVLNNVEFILHMESISNNHVEFISNNGWFPSVAQETLNSVGDISNSFPCQYELTVSTAHFHVNTNCLYYNSSFPCQYEPTALTAHFLMLISMSIIRTVCINSSFSYQYELHVSTAHFHVNTTDFIIIFVIVTKVALTVG